MRILIACAAAGLLLAGQVQAAPSEREASAAFVPTTRVDFQDPAAVRVFYSQLERTARQVCDSKISDRSMRREDAACVREATQEAVAKLSRPLLTAAHQTRSRTAFASGY
jgi:UrcA family protein